MQVPDIADLDGDGSVPSIDRDLRFSRYDGSDPRLQLVNEEKNFSPIVLEYMRKQWKIADRGFDYNVVAVFGSQSTGKSTLLNRLFGTNFDVMNESTGRQQTTKGIWASKSSDANILVLDVEGTDGGERFEDQDFERKSALFSLAISEVVIVNMYENNVGLYNGANLGLLKTVLDVNLQLFQQAGSPKTCLHFVIRDFTEQTPMTKLSATVMGYLHKIWDSLSKPAGKEDSKIEDFFDFAFVGLPHKVFAREAFESAVSKFRAKFNDKKHPEYVFKPNYHKHIPADGFPMFAESIWAKIISNRDLDLPTQTQLLAQHRCDEIAKEVYEKFTAAIVKFKAPLESGQVPESFGSETNALTSSLLDEFDSAASRYHAAVYQEKRSEFFDRMATALNVFYVQLLTNLHKQGVEMFKSSLQSKVTADESGGFMVKMRESMLEAETFYKTGAEAAKLKGASWENDKHLAKFLEAIRLIADEKRAEAISKMIAAFEKSAKTTMSESVQFAMNDASPTMWKSIVTAFKNFLDLTNAQLRKKCSGAYFIESCGAKLREADVLDDLGFESSEEEITNLFNAFRWQSWQILLEAIQKETADEILLGRLKARFEAKFRYDDKGVPRIWKLDDPIDNFFKAASDDVEKLIVMFARIDVPLQMIPSEIIEDENFNPSCLTVLNAAHLQTVRDRFKKDADMLFIEAKRSMVITTAKIPFWFVALTIILGWNEFMTVLSSPLYFIMLAILGGGAYTVWYLGMVGPLYSVVKATSKEVANQTRTALEDRGVSVDNILNGKVFQDPASIVGAPKRGNGTSNSPSPSPSSSSKKSDEYEMKGESRTVNQKVSAGGLSERRGYSVDAQ